MYIRSGSKIKDFMIDKKIGEGSYSNVYKAKRSTDQEYYAIKVIKEYSLKKEDKISLLNEINILSKHECKYLIRFHEVFTFKSLFFIVMEYAENKDLGSLIKRYKRSNRLISKTDISKWMYQLTSGIKYLHDRNIIHRDLKPANVLLDKNYTIKICDFGISKVSAHQDALAKTVIGSPIYMSPEIVSNKWYDSKVDIWALGCILFELITLDCAFTSNSMHALFKIINRGYYSKYKIRNPNYLALLDKMLVVNSERRYDIDQLIKYLPRMLDNDTNLLKPKMDMKETLPNKKILPPVNIPYNFNQLIDLLPSPSYDTVVTNKNIDSKFDFQVNKYPELPSINSVARNKSPIINNFKQKSKNLKPLDKPNFYNIPKSYIENNRYGARDNKRYIPEIDNKQIRNPRNWYDYKKKKLCSPIINKPHKKQKLEPLKHSYISPYNQDYLRNPKKYKIKLNPITNNNYIAKIDYRSEYQRNFVNHSKY